jgi:hypothetical protein
LISSEAALAPELFQFALEKGIEANYLKSIGLPKRTIDARRNGGTIVPATVRPISVTGPSPDREIDLTINMLGPVEVLREQGRNLTSMMSVAVGSLSRPQKILLAVQQLGRRHAAYGVEPRHYELVGTALCWMLEHVLGEDFTPAVREAWTEVYGLLATTMQDACAVH